MQVGTSSLGWSRESTVLPPFLEPFAYSTTSAHTDLTASMLSELQYGTRSGQTRCHARA